jgi:hypothetical protein
MLLGKEKHGHLKYAVSCDGTGCREGGAAIPKVKGLGDGVPFRRSLRARVLSLDTCRAYSTPQPASTRNKSSNCSIWEHFH